MGNNTSFGRDVKVNHGYEREKGGRTLGQTEELTNRPFPHIGAQRVGPKSLLPNSTEDLHHDTVICLQPRSINYEASTEDEHSKFASVRNSNTYDGAEDNGVRVRRQKSAEDNGGEARSKKKTLDEDSNSTTSSNSEEEYQKSTNMHDDASVRTATQHAEENNAAQHEEDRLPKRRSTGEL